MWFLIAQEWLAGKKTYILGAVYAIDAFGVHMQWWGVDQFRAAFEGVLMLFALRAGVSK
jgi:hypothetical protein